MKNMWMKHGILFLIGGFLYIIIEIIWRAVMGSTPTHWAMFFVGGFIFVILGGINEWIPWELSLLKQCGIGTCVVLLVEFLSGCVLNLWLDLHIWDYSDKFLNIMGQICPQFAIAWFILAGLGILLDDYLRYWIFAEEKPEYVLVNTKKTKINVKKNKKRQNKVEFSKLLVAWALVLTTLCVAVSYALSFFDHDPVQEVTVAVASACIAIGVAYQAKSYGEKNSRNKYGVKLDDDNEQRHVDG